MEQPYDSLGVAACFVLPVVHDCFVFKIQAVRIFEVDLSVTVPVHMDVRAPVRVSLFCDNVFFWGPEQFFQLYIRLFHGYRTLRIRKQELPCVESEFSLFIFGVSDTFYPFFCNVHPTLVRSVGSVQLWT